MCCVHLAVLGTVGGGLASSAHERLLQRLRAVFAQRGIAAVALALVPGLPRFGLAATEGNGAGWGGTRR